MPVQKKSGNLLKAPRIYDLLRTIKHQSFVYTQWNDQTVLFQAIHFSISHLFAQSLNVKQLFRPIDWTLSGATAPSQSEPGSNNNEGVLHIPQSSSITGASPSGSLVSYPGHSLVGVLPVYRDAVGVFYNPQSTGLLLGWVRTFLKRGKRSAQKHELQNETIDDYIYQPLRSGRIWHTVNFLSGV